MDKKCSDALIAIRQVQRKTELYARRLADMAALTPSQLMVLQILSDQGDTTAGSVAKATQLSSATITSLVDKLEARGYVTRRRDEPDRRRVWLEISEQGQRAISSAPDQLQEIFEDRFSKLPDWQQSMLVSSLEQVAAILDADDLDAAPILDVGPLDRVAQFPVKSPDKPARPAKPHP